MTDFVTEEFIRLVSSISLLQTEKDRIAENIIKKSAQKREFSGKYIAAASFVAVLAVGAYLTVRGNRQNINLM